MEKVWGGFGGVVWVVFGWCLALFGGLLLVVLSLFGEN